jgi:hypothetical protein
MPETCRDIYDNKSQLLHQFGTSHHLQENHHSIGPLVNIMEVVQVENKSSVMTVLEKFCIYEETQLYKHMT